MPANKIGKRELKGLLFPFYTDAKLTESVKKTISSVYEFKTNLNSTHSTDAKLSSSKSPSRSKICSKLKTKKLPARSEKYALPPVHAAKRIKTRSLEDADPFPIHRSSSQAKKFLDCRLWVLLVRAEKNAYEPQQREQDFRVSCSEAFMLNPEEVVTHVSTAKQASSPMDSWMDILQQTCIPSLISRP